MQEADSHLFNLRRKCRVHHPNDTVLAVNALCFHDPGEDSGRGHLGTRPEHINCFVQDDDARRHLRTLRAGMHNAMKTCTKDVLEILVFCKSGRQRNMALSVCFPKRALTTNCRVEGAPRLEHLNQKAWKHMYGWCGNCAQCNGFEAQTQIAHIAFFMNMFLA